MPLSELSCHQLSKTKEQTKKKKEKKKEEMVNHSISNKYEIFMNQKFEVFSCDGKNFKTLKC